MTLAIDPSQIAEFDGAAKLERIVRCKIEKYHKVRVYVMIDWEGRQRKPVIRVIAALIDMRFTTDPHYTQFKPKGFKRKDHNAVEIRQRRARKHMMRVNSEFRWTYPTMKEWRDFRRYVKWHYTEMTLAQFSEFYDQHFKD